MFAAVYVLLPISDAPPPEAIRRSMAPFERGGRGDVPDDRLGFHDETGHVRSLHGAPLVFTREEGRGTRIEGATDIRHLDVRAVEAEMAGRGVRRWAVRFRDLEPGLDGFARRFTRGLERHPATGGWGRWLNPLGRWDWWDLGGRFDGRISGEGRRPGRAAGPVSSGPNAGRALLAGVEDALGRALGSDPPAGVVVQADLNVEVVSRLLEDARAGLPHAVPEAVLLPPGSVPDRLRWLNSWPEVGPAGSLGWLGLPDTADWGSVVVAAYGRFPDHWAAGVAYHF